jgi:hypothetical protein
MKFSHNFLSDILIAVGPDQVRSAKQPVRPPAMFIFGDGNLDVGNMKMLAHGSWERPDDETLVDWLQSRTDGDNTAQFIGICHIRSIYYQYRS